MKPLRWNFKHWQLREKRGGPKGGYGEEPGLESHIMQSVFRHPRAQQCLRILLTKPGRLLRTASLHTWHCWTLLLSCWMLGSVSFIKFYISLLWLTSSLCDFAGFAAVGASIEHLPWYLLWRQSLKQLDLTFRMSHERNWWLQYAILFSWVKEIYQQHVLAIGWIQLRLIIVFWLDFWGFWGGGWSRFPIAVRRLAKGLPKDCDMPQPQRLGPNGHTGIRSYVFWLEAWSSFREVMLQPTSSCGMPVCGNKAVLFCMSVAFLVCKPLIGLRLESNFARIQRHPFAKSSIDWPGCQCLNAICAAKGLHGAEPLSTWLADQALVGLTSEEDRQHLVWMHPLGSYELGSAPWWAVQS